MTGKAEVDFGSGQGKKYLHNHSACRHSFSGGTAMERFFNAEMSQNTPRIIGRFSLDMTLGTKNKQKAIGSD